MIEINLVPDVKQEFIRAQRQRNTVISGAIIAMLASGGLIVLCAVLVGGQAVTGALYDKSISDENARLQSTEDLTNTVTIQNQLSKLGEMHGDKSIDSRVFDILSTVNPPVPNRVAISNLQLDPKDQVLTIEGSAVNGYEAVEVLKKTILNTNLEYTDDGEAIIEPLAEEVQVGETSYGEDSNGRKVLRFTITFEYNDQLFARDIQNAKIVSPNTNINVTDSFVRVPDSLFADRPSDIEEEN